MGSITVTIEILKGWISRYGEVPKCRTCHEQFKEGDLIESKNSGRVRARRFHEACRYSTPVSE